MSELTARFALPLLMAGQAQKEVTHNEALTLVDALLHPIVETMALAVPPGAPLAGQAWIVGAAPSGAWAGHAGALAIWTDGGWRFVAPRAPLTVWVRDQGVQARWGEQGWSVGTIAMLSLRCNGVQVVGARQPAVAPPSGGLTIDLQARETLGALLARLESHGLIATP
jgi:hypothetical protein